jgi:hypothetical protein
LGAKIFSAFFLGCECFQKTGGSSAESKVWVDPYPGEVGGGATELFAGRQQVPEDFADGKDSEIHGSSRLKVYPQ